MPLVVVPGVLLPPVPAALPNGLKSVADSIAFNPTGAVARAIPVVQRVIYCRRVTVPVDILKFDSQE